MTTAWARAANAPHFGGLAGRRVQRVDPSRDQLNLFLTGGFWGGLNFLSLAGHSTGGSDATPDT